MINVGLIRSLTIDDDERLNAHGLLIEESFPEIKVISRCIENCPDGIYDAESAIKGIPKVLKIVQEMDKENFDAIVISCCDDPGLNEAQKLVNTPVIGPGSAVAALALQCGEKIGVLLESDRAPTPELMKRILGERIVAVEIPKKIVGSHGLVDPINRDSIFEAADRLGTHDIDVIALACTGYSTLRLAPILCKRLNISVIDPVIAEASTILGILHSHSFSR